MATDSLLELRQPPESTVRVSLRLQPFYEAAEAVVARPGGKALKEFCVALRFSKLVWFQHDREQPMKFDYGGAELLSVGEPVFEIAEQRAETGDPGLILVRDGIREHLQEIRQRLEAPAEVRVEIDKERLARHRTPEA